MQTSLLIRVQARGGKFLGPDIGFSTVTVRNAATGGSFFWFNNFREISHFLVDVVRSADSSSGAAEASNEALMKS